MAERRKEILDTAWGKMVWALPTAGLAWWVYTDLRALETGAEAGVRVWWPVAVLYERVGYWPAVLLLPAIASGLLVAGLVQLARE
jgi:hypothetical protein